MVLEELQAVFDREAGIEDVLIEVAGAVDPGGKVDAEIAGDGERPQPRQPLRQIAEALAEIEGRLERGVVVGAAAVDRAGMGPGDVEPDERHQLVRRIDEELILRAGRQAAEAVRGRHALGLEVIPFIGRGEPEIAREALRDIGFEADRTGRQWDRPGSW